MLLGPVRNRLERKLGSASSRALVGRPTRVFADGRADLPFLEGCANTSPVKRCIIWAFRPCAPAVPGDAADDPVRRETFETMQRWSVASRPSHVRFGNFEVFYSARPA